MFFTEIYYHLFGRKNIEKLLEPKKVDYIVRKYRVPVDLFAVLKINGKDIFTKMADVSSHGCFIRLPNHALAHDENIVSVKFNLQGKNFTIESKIIWVNKGQNSKFPKGFGIEFSTPQPEIYDLTRAMLFNILKAK